MCKSSCRRTQPRVTDVIPAPAEYAANCRFCELTLPFKWVPQCAACGYARSHALAFNRPCFCATFANVPRCDTRRSIAFELSRRPESSMTWADLAGLQGGCWQCNSEALMSDSGEAVPVRARARDKTLYSSRAHYCCRRRFGSHAATSPCRCHAMRHARVLCCWLPIRTCSSQTMACPVWSASLRRSLATQPQAALKRLWREVKTPKFKTKNKQEPKPKTKRFTFDTHAKPWRAQRRRCAPCGSRRCGARPWQRTT